MNKAKATTTPRRKRFLYLVHKWELKTQEEIAQELHVESARLITENPGYELEKFSYPKQKPDGCLEYIITFKRK